MNETELAIVQSAIRALQTLSATQTAVATTAPWACPIHHTSRVVPAGVSKKTGKEYKAFVVCGEQSCNEKPPQANGATHASPAATIPSLP